MSQIFYSPERQSRSLLIKDLQSSKSVQKFIKPHDTSRQNNNNAIYTVPVGFQQVLDPLNYQRINSQQATYHQVNTVQKQNDPHGLRYYSPISSMNAFVGPPIMPVYVEAKQYNLNQSYEESQPWKMKLMELESRLKTLEVSRSRQHKPDQNQKTMKYQNVRQEIVRQANDEQDQFEVTMHELLLQKSKLKLMLSQNGHEGYNSKESQKPSNAGFKDLQQEQQMNEIKQHNYDLQSKYQVLQSSYHEFQQQSEVQASIFRDEIDGLKQDFIQSYQVNKELNDKIVILERGILRLENQLLNSENECRAVESQKNEFMNQLHSIEGSIKQLEDIRQDYELNLSEKDSQIRQLQDQRENLSNQILDAQQQNEEIITLNDQKEDILAAQIEVWKNKFMDLEKEFYLVKECYLIVEQENLKKKEKTSLSQHQSVEDSQNK